MMEALVVWIAVQIAPGVVEARPFIRLPDGQHCEFFTTVCMIKAEHAYGKENVDKLREGVLSGVQRSLKTEGVSK